MKISELIKELQKVKKEMGDINVYLDILPEKYLDNKGRKKFLYARKESLKGSCLCIAGYKLKPVCSKEEFDYNGDDKFHVKRYKEMDKFDGVYLSNNFLTVHLYDFEWTLYKIRIFIIEIIEKITFKRYRYKKAIREYYNSLPQTFEEGKELSSFGMNEKLLGINLERVKKLKPEKEYWGW